MSEQRPLVAKQFVELEQQHLADQLGMWVFLVTEVMFFGGLLVCYTVMRSTSPGAFAEASHHLSVLFGGIDTTVLLCSSLTMALAVRNIQLGATRATMALLLATAALGVTFLCLHGYEYYHEYSEHLFPGSTFHFEGSNPQRAEIFYWLYFATTGLHSFHVLIGVVLMLVIALKTARRTVGRERYMPVEITGLYWHFVDIVWVFLYPLFYLAGTRA